MTTSNISLLIHGLLAALIVVATAVLAIELKTIPPDVAGLFGVILGVAGVNGAGAVRAAVVTNQDNNAAEAVVPPTPLPAADIQRLAAALRETPHA